MAVLKYNLFDADHTAYCLSCWPGVGTLDNATCDTACSNKWDMICQIRHGCWSKIGSIFGLVLGTIGGAALLGFLALKFGWLASLLQMCSGSSGGSGLLSCCGGSGNGSKATKYGKGGKMDRHKRYDVKDRDSASGSRGDKSSRKASKSATSARHSSHRRSRSHSSVYGNNYDNNYNNEMFDYNQQAPGLQMVDRSNSIGVQSNKRVSRYSKQGNRRESQLIAASYSADEGLQPYQGYAQPEETCFDEDGQYSNIYSPDKAEDGLMGHTVYEKGISSSSGNGKKHSSSSSRVPAVPWDESAAGGGHVGRHAARQSRREKYEEDGNFFNNEAVDGGMFGVWCRTYSCYRHRYIYTA